MVKAKRITTGKLNMNRTKEEGELPRRRKNFPRSRHEFMLGVAYVLALAFLCANFAVSFGNTETLIKNYGAQTQAFELRHSINQLYGGLTEAELRERSFVVSGAEVDYVSYQNTRTRVETLLQELRSDINAVPSEVPAYLRLETLIRARLSSLNDRVKVRRERGRDAAVLLVRSQQLTSEMPEIRAVVNQVTRDQDQQIKQTLATVATSSKGARIGLWVSGLATLIIFAAVWRLSNAFLRSQRARAELEREGREELERQVDFRTRELQLANAELEAFAYSVSHDLRSPLRALGAMTTTLKQDLGPQCEAASQETVDRMHVAIRQMTHRIEDLLRLSQVTTKEIQRRTVNLSDLAQQIAETLSQRQPHANGHWNIQENITVKADPRLLDALLDNLLSNAWKFSSKSESPTVDVGVEDGRIYIRDNGAGFELPKDNNPFRPFRRFHSQEEFEGTGLGLSIAQRVISRHQGEIQVESAPGHGTTVRFSLG